MWLDIVKTVVQVLLGALIGYFANQRGADRQFAKQQVEKRVERATAAYLPCLRLVHKIAAALNMYTKGSLDPSAARDVDTWCRELWEAEFELKASGVPRVCASLGVGRVLALQLREYLQRGAGPFATDKTYHDRWSAMTQEFDSAQSMWAAWLDEQEANQTRASGQRRRRKVRAK